MVIGVVTEAKDKNILQRIFRFLTVKIIETEENPFKLVVVTIPHTKQSLGKMDARHCVHLRKRIVKKARKHGVLRLILSHSVMCPAFESWKEPLLAPVNDGKLLLMKLAPECIRKATRQLGEKMINQNVCISDSEMDRISEYLIRELCYDTKRIVVITQNLECAEKFVEEFFEESGLLVEVRTDLPGQQGILINVDEGYIKLGKDLYIQDIDFGYKLFGLEVKSIDIAACLRKTPLLKFKGIYSYEKKG